MRHIMLLTALIAVAPLAYAQTSGNQGTRSNPGASGPPGSMNTMAPTGSAPMAGQSDPGNCGTPDEPKPCPPMPRRAMQDYPANRR